MGHVSRSGAVAGALAELDHRPRCVGLGAPAPFERDGIAWEAADAPPPWEGVLLLDSYRLGADSVAGAGVTLAVIHDGDSIPAAASLAISVNEPAGPPPAGVRVAAGPGFAALRPQFRAVPEPSISAGVKRVLVTTGSSDRAASVAAIAAAVRDRVSAHLTAVIGPYSDARDVPADTLVTAPESLLEELTACDLVVCAAGQTMLEALACGTPCVAIPFVDNQRRQAEMLASRGAVVTADSVDEAASAAQRLAGDADERRRLSRAARETIDGRGAERAAAAVAELIRG